MRAGTAVVVFLLLSACAGGGAPPSTTTTAAGSTDSDEPGATRGSREAAHGDRDIAPSEATAMHRTASFTRVRLGAVAAAEDGLGATVAASAAVAVDLDAHRFPPRALDPVLEVGRLRFRHYTHPAPGVLRFIVADGAVLERGDELAVQYGDDVRSRVVLEAASSTGAPSSPSSPPASAPGAVTP